MTERPSFESIYMDLAFNMARRSTCQRLQVGCVITSPDFRKVIAVGYNGGASGLENDCESLEPGKCGHLHAECNAIINCDVPRATPKIVFCTDLPCVMCAKMLINLGGVQRVLYARDYRIKDALDLLHKAGIEHLKVPEPLHPEEYRLHLMAHLSGDSGFVEAITSEDRYLYFARILFGEDEPKLKDAGTAKLDGRLLRDAAKICVLTLLSEGGVDADATTLLEALHASGFDTATYQQAKSMHEMLLNRFRTFFAFEKRFRDSEACVEGARER